MNKIIKSITFLFLISFFSIKSVYAAQCTDAVSNAIKAPGSYDVLTDISRNGTYSEFKYTFKVTSSVKRVRDEIKNIDYTYECYDATFPKNEKFEYVTGTQYASGTFRFDNSFKKSITFNAPNVGNYVCIFKINSYNTSGGCTIDLKVDDVIETNKSSKATFEQCVYPTSIENLSDISTSPIDCNVAQNGEFEKEFCKAKNNAKANSETDKENGSSLYSENKCDISSKNSCGTFKFKCDPTNGIEGMINGNINPNDYVNVSYAYGSSVVSEHIGQYTYHYTPDKETKGKDITIKNECQEAVTVEYGAPIASKAGLCFQYKVKVTSRVVCFVKELPEPPEVSHEYCEPSPVCVHRDEEGSAVELDQGGPNEDFDSCIMSCDGGKYSSKCSSKCFNEVYAKSKLKKSSNLFLNNISATKMSDNNTCLPEKDNVCKPCKLEFSKNYYKKHPVYEGSNPSVCNTVSKPDLTSQCYFKYNNSHALIWYCPDTVPDSNRIYGRWYAYSENSDWGIVEQCRYSVYKSTDIGIPRRDHSNGERCHDVCHWEVDTASCGGTKYLNPGWAEYDNQQNMVIYNNAIKKAISSATCTTSTATFTIHATYYDSDEQKNVTIDFPYSSSNDSNVPDSLSSGDNTANTSMLDNTTIIGYDGCYKSKDEKKWYQAEWTFPGSYLDNKHNGLSYSYKDDWEKVDKAFCLPLNAGNVNISWYNWFMSKVIAGKDTSVTSDIYKKECIDKGDSKSITKITKFTDEENLVWNIVSKTRLFGYYKWNIDISCFYAINSNTSVGNTQNSTHENEDECTTDAQGYSIRSVDLKNLFPDSKGSTLTNPSETGRTPGFNWSEYATNTINNGNYKSDPSTYIEQVQKLGESVYSDDYLDYKFELDRVTLNKLKGHDYTEFAGEAVKRDNGIVSYYSDVITSIANRNNTSPEFNNGESYAPLRKYATQCNNLDKNGCSN